MTDVNQILRAPIFLTKNITIIAGSAIIVWIAMTISWRPDPPQPEGGWSFAVLIGVILGLMLGHRAYRSNVAQPIGTAFGVAWRIGLVWVVLAALAESVTGDAIVTMSFFPVLLLAFMVIIAGGFILGYLAGTLWNGVSNMSPQNLMVMFLSVTGIVLTIYFGIRSSGETERRVEEKRQEEQQNELIRQLEEEIERLQKRNNQA